MKILYVVIPGGIPWEFKRGNAERILELLTSIMAGKFSLGRFIIQIGGSIFLYVGERADMSSTTSP